MRRRLAADTADFGGAAGVEAVARDFDALVAIFERQLADAPSADDQSRAHILKAKQAAERGARLSRELLKRAQAQS